MSAYPAAYPPQPQPQSVYPAQVQSGVYPAQTAAPYGAYPADPAFAAPPVVAYPVGPAPMVSYPAPVTVVPVPVAPMVPVVQQQVTVAPPAPVRPLFVVDSQRRSTHQPGVLVYSAKFSQKRLSCLYSALSCPFCMNSCNNSSKMATLTHLDVYTNGVLFSKPHSTAHTCDGCCSHQAIGVMRYYDHPSFRRPVTSNGMCYGGLYGCFACQGSFGEQVTFKSSCGTECCCNLTKLSHYCSVCNCCYATETIFGLKEDEGRRLAAIINEQASMFRANPNQYRLDPLIENGVDTKFI